MKKLVTVVLALTLLVSSLGMTALAEDSAQLTEATFLYVATDGADTNSGSETAPFATIQAAVEAARKIDGTVVINLKEGYYQATDAVTLTAEDQDLVIRSLPGTTASVNGGVAIPYSDFKAVTDEAITGRIVEKDARDKIKSVNLKDYGVEDYGEMKIQGFLSSTEMGYASTLSYNDKMLTIAEYPNGKDYLYTGDILDDGANSERVLGDLVPVQYKLQDSQRYKKWTKADDIWSLAFYEHDWADATVPVTSIDIEKGIFNSYAGGSYLPVTNRRVKYMNLLEEIDVPGEWYLDRNTGELYIYAPEGIKNGEELVFNSYNKSFFTIDGAKNIKIENIRFAGSRAVGIDVKNADGIVINACEMTNIGDKAILFEGCYNSGVTNSYLHDLGSWGICIYRCGDKETLTPGNCFVTNCEIRTYSQYRKTYCPGVHLNNDVASVVSYNEIHDAPHFAIRYDSNDNIIEYNEFYDVCQDTADTGAVYTGRYWNTWGNKLRYNYFHDLEMIATNTGMKTWAVYLDDMHSQTDVYSNVFYNVEYVALMGGGRNNSFTNNLMIDCANPLRFDSRGMTWSLDNITKNTNAVDWHTDVWAEKYPELVNLMEDEPGVPKYNTLSGNVLYRTPEFNLDEPVVTYGTVENNITINDKKAFVDYANQNFALAEDSIVYKKLPEFEQIPFDQIGRYDYTYTESYKNINAAADASVIKLTIGSDKLYKGSEAVTLDVPAQVQNDRTLVPLRAIFEALGAEVLWDEATQTVTSTRGDITIKLTIGSDQLYKNDEAVTLDVPAQVQNDRTLVPVRAISESFGCQVDWEEATQTVTIHVPEN